jgi:hypothetical protein
MVSATTVPLVPPAFPPVEVSVLLPPVPPVADELPVLADPPVAAVLLLPPVPPVEVVLPVVEAVAPAVPELLPCVLPPLGWLLLDPPEALLVLLLPASLLDPPEDPPTLLALELPPEPLLALERPPLPPLPLLLAVLLVFLLLLSLLEHARVANRDRTPIPQGPTIFTLPRSCMARMVARSSAKTPSFSAPVEGRK